MSIPTFDDLTSCATNKVKREPAPSPALTSGRCIGSQSLIPETWTGTSTCLLRVNRQLKNRLVPLFSLDTPDLELLILKALAVNLSSPDANASQNDIDTLTAGLPAAPTDEDGQIWVRDLGDLDLHPFH